MRRVVTGIDEHGRAVFVQDGEPEEITIGDGAEPVGLMWGWDSPPTVPNDGIKPPYRTYFPPVGGLRVLIVPISPDSARVEVDPAVADERFPGVLTDAVWDPDQPGIHITQTVDIGLILEGSVILELDDGATRRLETGDWYVMNGTRHAWRNPFETRALLAIFLAGMAADAASPAGPTGGDVDQAVGR